MEESINQIRTYSFHYYDERLFELCKESGSVYSTSLDMFWDTYKTTGKWLSKFDLQKEMNGKIERNNLHSDSYLASMQQVHANLASWRQAKKINESAKAPHKHKFLQPVFFKKSQIKYKDGLLVITLDKNKNYIVLPWNIKMPIPIYGHVGYNQKNGWKINLSVETNVKQKKLLQEKALSVDLGVKRIATLFDNNRVVTMSGKKLLGLLHYRNKTSAKYQEKLSKKTKGSNNEKRLQRARRKVVEHMQNIQTDILHKQSRFIVDYAVNHRIGKIVFGNNAGVHNKTNCGTNNNQKIQQFPEQKLKNYVSYKFECVSGIVDSKPEPYTSQRCPICKKLHKTNTRVYKCNDCGFVYDRDGVGAINIYNENVSLVEDQRIRRLMRPFGLKYDNNLSFKHSKMLSAENDYSL